MRHIDGDGTMGVQARRLVWASALAVGLCQFALLGFVRGSGGGSITAWASCVAPWLGRLAVAAPVIVVGVVTACLLRPRRPERLAALIGALAGLPTALAWALPEHFGTSLLMLVFGGGVGMWQRYLWRDMAPVAYRLVVMLLNVGLPGAVAAWVGAHYWRTGNWQRFWKGSGGAIIRGGLVAGALGVAIELVRWQLVLEPTRAAAMAAQHMAWEGRPLWQVAFLTLNAVAFGLVVTALLVRWRPKWWWGAFAGSGIALVWLSISLLGTAFETISGGPAMLRLLGIAAASAAVVQVLKGAVAGGYAGSWEAGGET